MKKILIQLIAAVCLVSLTNLAIAQLPDVQTQNGIQYLTGGIGSEESDAIKADAHNWSMEITFSEIGPERARWVADIDFQIQNASNQVILKAVSEGPLVLVKLPKGQYTISAINSGVEVHHQVEVKTGGVQKVSIFWKPQEALVK